MRASAAVGLLLASSMSIFGLYGRHLSNSALAAGPEPVWVNGQMGVYNPDTGVFVPSTSPEFDATCDLIQRRRAQASGGSGSWGYGHHWIYYPGSHMFSYPMGGVSGMRSSSGFSSSHFSSIRGGIGSTGHSFGASHS